jgi:hypothetical protein
MNPQLPLLKGGLGLAEKRSAAEVKPERMHAGGIKMLKSSKPEENDALRNRRLKLKIRA